MISENTARFAGGSYLPRGWVEAMEYVPEKRTGEEIVADVMRDAGLVFGDDN